MAWEGKGNHFTGGKEAKREMLQPKSKRQSLPGVQGIDPQGAPGQGVKDLFLLFWRGGFSKERQDKHFVPRAMLGAGVDGREGTVMKVKEQ